MTYEIGLTILCTALFFVLIFACMILFMFMLCIYLLFKKLVERTNELDRFIADSETYQDIGGVEEAAHDMISHCETMASAVDHSETVLYENFKNHLERFVFQLETIKSLPKLEE